MSQDPDSPREGRHRERSARILGFAAALAVVVLASLTLRWPAPIIAALVEYGVYRLVGRGQG